jgi:hypothetical protein
MGDNGLGHVRIEDGFGMIECSKNIRTFPLGSQSSGELVKTKDLRILKVFQPRIPR